MGKSWIGQSDIRDGPSGDAGCSEDESLESGVWCICCHGSPYRSRREKRSWRGHGEVLTDVDISSNANRAHEEGL
jgi:hypothetical protein